MRSKILILGAEGMLGQAVVSAATSEDHAYEVIAAGRSDLDLTDTVAISARLEEGFDAVINCAAFTAVDACETEVDLAMEINGHAVGRLAEVCASRSVALLHVSTDYVFAGDGRSPGDLSNDPPHVPRPYQEDDPVAPASVYGKSKQLGERLALNHGALVVRASWLFGSGGDNFVRTMLWLAESGKPIRVVDDQVGCPTYTPYLAQGLLRLLSASRSPEPSTKLFQLFHYASPPAVSWFDFARGIFDEFGLDVDVKPCRSSEYPRPAPRPSYSVLSTERWKSVLSEEPRPWKRGLKEYRLLLERDSLENRLKERS